MYTAFKNASASFRSLNSNIRKDLTQITNKKISRVIDDVSDQPCFQQDLDNLHQWSIRNAMQLSVKKCKVMSITKKRQPLWFLIIPWLILFWKKVKNSKT